MIAVLAVLISGLGLPVAEAAAKPPKVWVPPQTALPQTKPVKGSNAKPVNAKAPPGKPWKPDVKAKAPVGSATVSLGSAGGSATASRPKPVQAGGLPVWLSAPAGARPSGKSSGLATGPAGGTAGSGEGSLRVEVNDEAKTRAAGVRGALVALTDAKGAPASGKVQVGFDVTAWAKTTGANWGDRAHVVRLPDCALTTPGAAGCTARTPVASHRDASGRLIVEVDVPKATAETSSPLRSAPRAQSAPEAVPLVLAPQAVALAVEPGPSGASGDFTATPLSPSASWSAGANAANFTYGYTVEVPSSIAGPGPSLGLGTTPRPSMAGPRRRTPRPAVSARAGTGVRVRSPGRTRAARTRESRSRVTSAGRATSCRSVWRATRVRSSVTTRRACTTSRARTGRRSSA